MPTTITISIDNKDVQEIDEICEKTGFRRSSLCRVAIRALIRDPNTFLSAALSDNKPTHAS